RLLGRADRSAVGTGRGRPAGPRHRRRLRRPDDDGASGRAALIRLRPSAVRELGPLLVGLLVLLLSTGLLEAGLLEAGLLDFGLRDAGLLVRLLRVRLLEPLADGAGASARLVRPLGVDTALGVDAALRRRAAAAP